ncbi:MAG: hypothetical protein QG657_3340 [Acidobacteriota bacterium]|nr:hypothetical protein [Acidobacteriota bacterium]
MIFKKSSLEDYFQNSRIALINARDNKRIYPLISTYNLTAEKLESDLTVLDKLVAADKEKTEAHGAQLLARNNLVTLLEEAHPVYMEHANFAKLICRTNTARLAHMMLLTPREKNVNGWLRQTDTFYTNMFLDTELIASLEASSITADKLNANYEKVKGVSTALVKYQEAIGEAQAATARRNKLMEEFDFIMTEFIFICRMALKKEPQLLEILKISVLSAGYVRQKTKEAKPVDTSILKSKGPAIKKSVKKSIEAMSPAEEVESPAAVGTATQEEENTETVAQETGQKVAETESV